jgi:hypothetical protein
MKIVEFIAQPVYIWFLNDMNKRQYNFWLYRLLCLLMAFSAINLSVPVRDTSCLTCRTITGHDLSVNKINSLSEFILEEWLGLGDAVPEHNDPDEESELTELQQDYDFFQLFVFAPLLPTVQYLTTGNMHFWPEHIPAYVPEINAPPPRL